MDAPAKDDGLKWFGEGFDGFPKRLPDDCVEYIVHVIHTKLQTAAATRTRLNKISKASNDLKKKLLEDYIWQRDSFDLKLYPQPTTPDADNVKVPNSDTLKGPPHLRGRTNFGDSVADEWLVVYLLLELSKQFPESWIRVYDTDGEFLLIEAANALPKWLNPEIAENRVWISNGHLRLIPLLDSDSTSRNLSLQDALSFIDKQPDKLIISSFVEDEAFYRLREYPSAISSSLHHALITIPRRLASILHRNPVCITPAVEAFYLRDPVSLRPLMTKDISTLQLPPEDFVTVSTKFTKVGYAQLRSQVFGPPPAWTAVVPRMQDPKAEMGMKLTCGFEMLVSDLQNADTRAMREVKLLLEDIENGEEVLPLDAEMASWPQMQDDEKWLDIDYNDFEDELSGKARRKDGSKGTGFGDSSAQDNLRKIVSRFEDFLNDGAAGAEGVDDLDEDNGDADDDNDNISDSGSNKDKDAMNIEEAEFEEAMKEMVGMPADHIEKSGLMDEARKLAVEDAENASDVDEDEEMKKVMDLMERELKGHGALDLKDGVVKKTRTPNATKTDLGAQKEKETQKPFFGPERPPGIEMKRRGLVEIMDEEIGPGDEELSSDDEEYNDVDLGLAKNMLESFKGQAGMAGPAGNLMKALGVGMPRDEGIDDNDDNGK